MSSFVHLKHSLFRHFTLLVLGVSAVGLALLIAYGASVDWKIVVPAVSVVLSMIFFAQKQRLDELRLFTELFARFNERYDSMNEDLALLEKTSDLTDADRAKLVDYFNLCGEEYLYYKLGYIYPEVWDAWLAGMRSYYANDAIREIWQKELQQGSYYGLTSRLLDTRGPRT